MPGNQLPSPDHADEVSSRNDLIAYIGTLHTAVVNGRQIENNTTERLLEALGAWISDSPGFYRNTGRQLSDEATWSFIAHALSAALIYE